MSKFIIFNSIDDADIVNNRITDNVKVNWVDGITNKYSQPIKHPEQNLWALVIDDNYKQYFTQEEINNSVELTNDWFVINVIT